MEALRFRLQPSNQNNRSDGDGAEMYVEGMVSDMKAPHVTEGESFQFPRLCYSWIEFVVFVFNSIQKKSVSFIKEQIARR